MSYVEEDYSWYVRTGCVASYELAPLSLVVFGALLQTFISTAIAFPKWSGSQKSVNNNSAAAAKASNDDDSHYNYVALDIVTQDEVRADTHASSNTNSTLYLFASVKSFAQRVLQTRAAQICIQLLTVWQIVSLLLVTIFDILKFTAFRDRNVHILNGWELFQCYSSILMTSSNSKTILINCIGVTLLTRNNLSAIFRLDSKLKMSWCILTLLMYFGVYGVILMVYYMIAAIVYCTCLCGLCLHRLIPYMYGEQGKWKMVLFWTFCMFLLISFNISGLLMVNLYSGQDYFISIANVMTERRWDTYFQHLKQEGEHVFRFFTLLFG